MHFDQWLNNKIKNEGDKFINALLEYVEENIIFAVKNKQKSGENEAEIALVIFESLLVE